MKFKVGDRVRRIRKEWMSDYGDHYIGIPFNITTSDGKNVIDPEGQWHDSDYLELVESSSELQDLVDKANEGYTAIDILEEKYSSQIEIGIKGGGFHSWDSLPYAENQRNRNVRIKSQTRKFKVAHWEAEIKGEEVIIGCKTFQKYDLTQDIKVLVKCNHSVSGGLYAQRCGIQDNNGNCITWQEAEKLLEELEK